MLSPIVDPGGAFLYSLTSSISAFKIDANTGALTSVSGSPFLSLNGGTQMGIDPTSKFLFVVAEDGAHTLAIAASTGALTEVPGSPVSVVFEGLSLAVHPTGKCVFAYNPSQIVTPQADPVTSLMSQASAVMTAGLVSAIGIDPTGTYLYATDQTQAIIYGYSIDATTGALTELSGFPFSTPVNGLTSILAKP